MENTFEKFIELKNLQKEPLITIDGNLNDSFSRMNIKNNCNKDNVVIESPKMVSETSKKYEERSEELLAQKNDALMKKFENLNRRKSKEAEEALRLFANEENQNIRKKSLENVKDVTAAEITEQKNAAIKKRSEALNLRKTKETEETLRSFNYEKNQNLTRKSLEPSVNEYKTFGAETFVDKNQSLADYLEIRKAEEEQKIKEEETKKAQEKMLLERNMKLHSQCIPKNTESRNLNDSDDFFLNKNNAEELKKLKAYTKKMEKERKAKESKEEAARLLVERQERMNYSYSPDKIGMTADSFVSKSDQNQNSISEYSTTSIDGSHHPPGIPKSTGAIKSK